MSEAPGTQQGILSPLTVISVTRAEENESKNSKYTYALQKRAYPLTAFSLVWHFIFSSPLTFLSGSLQGVMNVSPCGVLLEVGLLPSPLVN